MDKKYTEQELDELLKNYMVWFGPQPDDEPGKPGEIEVQIPFCGLYESAFTSIRDNHEEYEKDYIRETLQGGEAEPSDFNLGEWEMDMLPLYEWWIDCLREEVKERTEIDLNMRFASIWSPREYNFCSDVLTVWVEKDGLRKLIDYILADKELAEELKERVHDACTPSSGYMPYHSEDEFAWSKDKLPACFYELLFQALIPDCIYNLETRWWDCSEPDFYPAGELDKLYEKRKKEKEAETQQKDQHPE